MLIRGIKKGKTIEFSEDIDFPDEQELLVQIKAIDDDFWSALQDFRQRVDLGSIDDDTFEDVRDRSPGREVDW